jgi:hypothetical protein
MNFEGFPKIARWSREIIITEKIDGTNAAILIENGVVKAQSRNRFITPDDDNYGFAAWVEANKDALIAALGEGRHFGEWFGSGIQRGYGMDRKMFALFNTTRWKNAELPDGVMVVPELYRGPMEDWIIQRNLQRLEMFGSKLFGFNRPEGIVIYHTAAKVMFKKTLYNDEAGKGD